MSTQKQGEIPKGIQTTQSTATVQEVKPKAPTTEKDFVNAIVSNNPKAQPELPTGSARVLFDQTSRSDAPRNVYRETIHTQSGDTLEYVWWHCENGNYVGRKEVRRINPKTEESYLLGHDFNILASKENLKKIAELATGKTKFYKKYQSERTMVDKEKFL